MQTFLDYHLTFFAVSLPWNAPEVGSRRGQDVLASLPDMSADMTTKHLYADYMRKGLLQPYELIEKYGLESEQAKDARKRLIAAQEAVTKHAESTKRLREFIDCRRLENRELDAGTRVVLLARNFQNRSLQYEELYARRQRNSPDEVYRAAQAYAAIVAADLFGKACSFGWVVPIQAAFYKSGSIETVQAAVAQECRTGPTAYRSSQRITSSVIDAYPEGARIMDVCNLVSGSAHQPMPLPCVLVRGYRDGEFVDQSAHVNMGAASGYCRIDPAAILPLLPDWSAYDTNATPVRDVLAERARLCLAKAGVLRQPL